MRLSYLFHGPTPGQLRVLRALHFETKATGHSPTIRELCNTLGLSSTNSVAEHLEGLEALGLVEHRAGAARTLRLTAKGLEKLRDSFKGAAREAHQ